MKNISFGSYTENIPFDSPTTRQLAESGVENYLPLCFSTRFSCSKSKCVVSFFTSLFVFFFFLLSSFLLFSSPVHADWPMVAHDPQRTSYAPENNSNIENVPVIHKWVREIPFPDYIPQRGQLLTVQIGANDGIVLVPTAGGVYALEPRDGRVLWKYTTDMALGESPAVVDMVMYVPVLDKTIHAVNISKTGATLKWKTDKAGSGYYASPLVANGKVYIGNRDGFFYAFNTTDGSLAWHYPGIDGKPRDRFYSQSAAISPDNSTVYVATSDSYVIALDAARGTQKAISIKFPGDGFHVYWPVYYTGDPNDMGDDGVAVARSTNYPTQDRSMDLVTLSAKVGQNQEHLFYLKNDICVYYGYNDCPVTNQTTPQLLSTTRFEQWHSENPDGEIQYFLNPQNLSKKYISPAIWWGNNGDNMPPPVAGPNGKLYYMSSWFKYHEEWGGDWFGVGRLMEWKPGEHTFRPLPDSVLGTQSHDQAETLAFFHNNIVFSGIYDWGFNKAVSDPVGRRSFNKWDDIKDKFPGFGLVWRKFKYGIKYYDPATSANLDDPSAKTGLTDHGIQSPLVPLKENVFFHKMNTVLMMCFDRNQNNQCDSEI